MEKITPFIWFNSNAEEAVNFYLSVFKKGKILSVSRYGKEGQEMHKKKPGTVMAIDFIIEGQHFTALNGGPEFPINEAVSFVVHCRTQQEVDYYWDKLTEGGQEVQCGWLKDKYGVSWQIVPDALGKIMSTAGPRIGKVMEAFFKMKKIDIRALQHAARPTTVITVRTTVRTTSKKTWEYWNNPRHIVNWYVARSDWETPYANNNPVRGGSFTITMAAKDKSQKFDFTGIYSKVVPERHVEYEIPDGRKVMITFIPRKGATEIVEAFETENTHTLREQRTGWQAILNTFKRYVEKSEHKTLS